jgi:quinoprotein glucose dehydrogenase
VKELFHPVTATLVAGLLSLTTAAAPGTEWPDYGGGPDQSKYAVTPDITRRTVAKLAVAWTYPTGDERAYQFNPVIADGVMYVLAKNSSLVALDVKTRRELWIHANLRGITNRGINLWQSRDGKERRLLFVVDDLLQAIDARTGKSIPSFGRNGAVDLREAADPRQLARRRLLLRAGAHPRL